MTLQEVKMAQQVSKKAMDIILMPGQHAGLLWFEPWTIVFVPATIPLRYSHQVKVADSDIMSSFLPYYDIIT